MDLGNAIVKLRKEKGLRQNELARISNLSQTYLSQIENNQKDITFKTLNKISQAMGVPTPILVFYSLSEDDVPVEKREAYKMVEPIIQAMIEQFVK